jgi:hypothetical protein
VNGGLDFADILKKAKDNAGSGTVSPAPTV